MGSELKFQEKVIDYLKKRKIWHIRYTASTTFGLPDIIAIHHGYFIGIELKRPDGKGKPSALQTLTVDSINKAGGVAKANVSSLKEVEELLKIAESKALSKTSS